jgi:hypothetical protein
VFTGTYCISAPFSAKCVAAFSGIGERVDYLPLTELHQCLSVNAYIVLLVCNNNHVYVIMF